MGGLACGRVYFHVSLCEKHESTGWGGHVRWSCHVRPNHVPLDMILLEQHVPATMAGTNGLLRTFHDSVGGNYGRGP